MDWMEALKEAHKSHDGWCYGPEPDHPTEKEEKVHHHKDAQEDYDMWEDAGRPIVDKWGRFIMDKDKELKLKELLKHRDELKDKYDGTDKRKAEIKEAQAVFMALRDDGVGATEPYLAMLQHQKEKG